MNYEGPVTVRATSTGADATLAGIARLVADAQVRNFDSKLDCKEPLPMSTSR